MTSHKVPFICFVATLALIAAFTIAVWLGGNVAFVMTAHKIFVVCFVVVLALNAIVSIALAASSYFSWRQKVAQVLLVWFVPFFGSVFIGMFLIAQGPMSRARANTIGARDLDSYAANLPSATSQGL